LRGQRKEAVAFRLERWGRGLARGADHFLLIMYLYVHSSNKYQFYVLRCLAFRPTFRSIALLLSSFRGFSWSLTELRNLMFSLLLSTLVFIDCYVFIFFRLTVQVFLAFSISSYFRVYSNGATFCCGCQSKPAKLYWYPTELLLRTWLSLSETRYAGCTQETSS